MNDQKNMIFFIIILVGVMVGWNYFYEAPKAEHTREVAAQQQHTPGPLASAPQVAAIQAPLGREEAITTSSRVKIDTPSLDGSINLKGGLIDDLTLMKYLRTTEKNSPHVVLLEPLGTKHPYFASFGWTAADKNITLPDENTVWTANRSEISQSSGPVTLTWTNPQGVLFERQISVDNEYMFTIEQSVTNNTGHNIQLVPYSQITRVGTPELNGYVQEGPLGYMGDKLHTYQYDKLQKGGEEKVNAVGGWVGITDKYWLTSVIPDQKTQTSFYVEDKRLGSQDTYVTGYLGEPLTIAPGQKTTIKSNLFAGAKVLSLLDHYEEVIGIKHFDLAVDFGYLYLITKPMFYLLLWFYSWIGNLGLAILFLTLLIKVAFYPLANKSYRSMARMKDLQPKMESIKKRYGDDKMRMNQEMMELYKREKVNPASGCLPILIQLPVFIALYNVLSISIEMRHAPFYGWIKDLSAPDPTTVFNLFGLLPWDPPSLLMVGVLPLLMGISMWIQQKLNPAPMDPAQQTMFTILPVVMTFLFAQFPAGLVLYWTANNVLSIIQQWVIMTSARRRERAKA